MSYQLFIGLRYLKAKRKQSFISVITFISIIGIMVGVTALIVVLSVMNGFEETLKEKILGLNAHVVVVGFGSGLGDYDTLAETVRTVDGVKGASPFTYSQAMLSGSGGSTGAVVRGVDPSTIADVTTLPERITEGTLSGIEVPFGSAANKTDSKRENAGAKKELPGIVIGTELSKSTGAMVGDRLNVISPMGTMTPAGPVPRMTAFTVSGIFEFGMYEYDSSVAFISIENAQKFFRLGDTVTGIEVKIEDIYKAETVADDILVALKGNYWTRTWMEMNRNLFSALKLEKVAMFIILTLIILVAALNIISTLIMVVMEKNRDIAILKSLGATSGGIMRIFMIEGLVIGFTGTLLGAVAGVGIAMNLEGIVAIVERTFNFKVLPPSVYYIDKLPSEVEPLTVAIIVALSVTISFLATLYPSYQASKLNPVEGLRYE
ncbi:MAG: lipoprotein-releasing ABC transporter permease subunit [Proteobacteria bacterium]|nr:lipoprotein-releasing ABC transporter permease subunit [Pseudomonadota bacterium]